MKFLLNFYLDILKLKSQTAYSDFNEASKQLEYLDTFHYYQNMDPLEYSLKRFNLEEKISIYKSRVSNYNAKIRNLSRKLN